MKGKTTIVTGGAGGIGKAYFEMLAAFGANEVVLYFAAPISSCTSGEVIFINGGRE